ncbi:Na+/H+ antiporter [Pseudomonas citronellolis]|uniref:Na+/H+ antiporter n=1 Tax=Pseudomonas citronellolis TaxID=53408 RepID=A0A127MXV2_9PSED|nr:Na+/H+ antiporter [Pseudomonas citronellolis]AMO78164.1 Sodium, potassium, lithium and rubidium/H(+) antiporter [Pseudomonas citronellolis]ANI16847.1 Na+/H+ antiporter [Pseudomonas citronellolis]MCP1641883.1 CPA1 family monovalent cation:H+ antiporter [Pseudomonas citronellolis]MCP1664801.1 CPA1 family monovalent cation:H+ antiporter [Pseudomonas citronellolis]MCP1695740.1 CPA1 family monovalent cation:H+ antiporter [Pseudomonas citronellolis]
MQTVYTVLILLLVVGGTRLLAQLLPLPLPLIQIASGAVLAWPSLGLHVALDPELFMFLFIPPLLFADGWRMPKGEFWQMRWPILTMAFALVLFTVAGGGAFIHLLIPEIPWAAAFALAAVLSPTDALAVSAIAQNRLPRRLMHVLQGEALMNDASGLVAFKFAVAAAMTGAFSLLDASLSFLLVAVGGLACGVVLSWLLGRIRAWMIRRGWDDPATHVVLMLLLPFAVYMVAEELGVSGILAAVAAGMMQSWTDLLPRQTHTRVLNRSVWSMLEFAFNGVVFLLLGLQLPDILKSVTHHAGDSLWRSSQLLFYVLAVYAVLILLRFAWVWCYWKLSLRFERWWGIELGGKPGEPVLRLSAISALGGVRGAVTLAGVLSVPLLLGSGEAFPQRDLIIFIAAGVILVSLLAATLGLPALLKGLPVASNDQSELEYRSVWRRTAVAAIRMLEKEEMPAGEKVDAEEAARLAEVKARLMAEYRQQLDPAPDSAEARERARSLELADQALRIKALRTQRLELYQLRRENLVDDETMRKVLGDLDSQEAWLTSKAGRWV